MIVINVSKLKKFIEKIISIILSLNGCIYIRRNIRYDYAHTYNSFRVSISIMLSNCY